MEVDLTAKKELHYFIGLKKNRVYNDEIYHTDEFTWVGTMWAKIFNQSRNIILLVIDFVFMFLPTEYNDDTWLILGRVTFQTSREN